MQFDTWKWFSSIQIVFFLRFHQKFTHDNHKQESVLEFHHRFVSRSGRNSNGPSGFQILIITGYRTNSLLVLDLRFWENIAKQDFSYAFHQKVWTKRFVRQLVHRSLWYTRHTLQACTTLTRRYSTLPWNQTTQCSSIFARQLVISIPYMYWAWTYPNQPSS